MRGDLREHAMPLMYGLIPVDGQPGCFTQLLLGVANDEQHDSLTQVQE